MIPDEVWRRYDEAVDKAYSVGAMKQLRNAEAEIGRIFIAVALEAKVVAPPAPLRHELIDDYDTACWRCTCGKMYRTLDNFKAHQIRCARRQAHAAPGAKEPKAEVPR